jgi:hypothetical protein
MSSFSALLLFLGLARQGASRLPSVETHPEHGDDLATPMNTA